MYRKYLNLLSVFFVVTTNNVATAEVFLPSAAVTNSLNSGLRFQSPYHYRTNPGLSRQGQHFGIRKWIHRTHKSIRSSNINTHGMAFTAISAFYRDFPYLAAFLTCGVKGVSADLIVQSTTIKRVHKIQAGQKEHEVSMDWKRALTYLLYGAFYQGMVQEYLYNNVFPAVFGTSSDFNTVAIKVVFGTYILTPLITLPTVYMTKALVFGYSLRKALQEYIYDIQKKGLLKKCWLLWTPVNAIAFAFVPEHFRITFIAMVSFVWVMILSAVAAK
uniref:Uncharacterized protein n=1 Tax=Asterionellopsis glacialis TaxID=33640 RepID=A0A7S0PVC0_9STRA|mmetsp:Transcript_1189/g.1650  ORF Transcript_1189/g.1650 Transcript_1189/m.1650 type:complete len:273 (+) Transcript_1189:1-819(+)